jgi:hypothetical protein
MALINLETKAVHAVPAETDHAVLQEDVSKPKDQLTK